MQNPVDAAHFFGKQGREKYWLIQKMDMISLRKQGGELAPGAINREKNQRQSQTKV
jgi:hypothetical protein